MDRQVKIKNVFKPLSVHKEFFTGGNLQLTKDGKTLLCQCEHHITIVDIEKVLITNTIPEGFTTYNPSADNDYTDDNILTFVLSDDDSLLATGHKSGLINVWKWKESELVTAWKSGHKGTLSKLCFNENNVFVTSGSTDASLKVWNIETHTCVFRLGSLQGIISVLEYHKINNEEYLFASGDEAVIRGWRLSVKEDLVYKFGGHTSKITKIMFTPDESYLISCGRDKVIIVWDLKEKKSLRTIPTYESIETAALLPECIKIPGYEMSVIGTFIATGGENGITRIWDVIKGKELHTLGKVTEKPNAPIVHVMFSQSDQTVYEVNSFHYIIVYNLDNKFNCQKQIAANLGEILDVVFFGENDNYLAVATNSCDIHLYDENMNCNLLKGHTDLVVSLATSRHAPNLLISGGKDNSIRVWMMMDEVMSCVAVGARHTASVGSVAFSFSPQNPFVISVSEDTTMKQWKLPILKYKQCISLNVSNTEIIHEKAINSVCVSPNPKSVLIATASQDKTAKLWSGTDLSLIGVLRGHRRGVWCAKFSPVDRVLITSSADSTLRLWSITDLNCLKTLEGQDCAILNCNFFNNGSQLISAGSDGLLKLWEIKSGECVATLDHHAARVWALAINKDETKIVTGGQDSRIVFWEDKTEEARLDNLKANQERIQQEQQLSNLIRANELLPALKLAIKLDRPKQAFKILESLSSGNMDGLKSIVNQLSADHKETLLNYATEWNTNSKYCLIAQLVISLFVEDIAENKIRISNKTLEGMIAYTNRHHQRLNTLKEDLNLITYTLKMMQPASN